MNKVVLMGNLCKDPELRFLPNSQMAVTNLTLAINSYKKDKTKETTFIPVVIFGKQAEIISEKVTKGNRLLIEGSIKIDNYTNKQGQKIYKTYVVANNSTIIDWAETKEPNFNKNNNNFDNIQVVDDGDIPF